MHKKKTSFHPLYYFFVFLFLISGCNCTQRTTKTISPTTAVSKEFSEVVVNNESSSYEISTFDVVVPDGWEIGCIAGAEHCIYYELCKIDPATSLYCEVQIHKFDPTTKSDQVLTSITSNNTDLFWTNELTVVNDFAFWVFRNGNEMRIDCFSLKNNTFSVIKKFEPEQSDIILTANSKYITWFEPEATKISLYTYDPDTNAISLISNSVTTDSSYSRAYVCDNTTAFIEISSGDKTLMLYDLDKQQNFNSYILSNDFELTRLQANKEYMICTNGYHSGALIFFLDIASGQFNKVDLSEHETNLFSCHLIGDEVFINSSLHEELVVLSLSTHSFTVIPVECALIQACVSGSGEYIACNASAGTIFSVVKS